MLVRIINEKEILGGFFQSMNILGETGKKYSKAAFILVVDHCKISTLMGVCFYDFLKNQYLVGRNFFHSTRIRLNHVKLVIFGYYLPTKVEVSYG